MANQKHLDILKQGVEVWNEWRQDNKRIEPNLSGADLKGIDLTDANLNRADLGDVNLSGANLIGATFNDADLGDANLSRANLSGASLYGVYLSKANLSGADLSGTRLDDADLSEAILTDAILIQAILPGAILSKADLSGANLTGTHLNGANLKDATITRAKLIRASLSGAVLSNADLKWAEINAACLWGADLRDANLIGTKLNQADLRGAKLRNAHLIQADLSETILTEADLSGAHLNRANLKRAVLIETTLSNADLTDCEIFGISAWKLNLDGANQTNLIITDDGEPVVTIDNLEIAQFVYLLLHNPKLRDIIDTIGKKAVLIFGNFKDERKAVLNAMRDELRKQDYIPMLFDFDKPMSRSYTETIVTLAHLSRFIIADITDARSVREELRAIVPQLPSVAVQPIIKREEYEYEMFQDYELFRSVLPVHQYENQDELIAALVDEVIRPAEEKVKELRQGS